MKNQCRLSLMATLFLNILPIDAQAITSEDVILGYKTYLQREPESQAAIEEKIKTHKTLDQLRKSLIDSVEFREKNNIQSNCGDHHPALNIQLDFAPDIMQRMFAHIQEEWGKLGETEPYWSVLTNDIYKTSNIEDTITQFYETGSNDAKLITDFANRSNVIIPSDPVMFELGTGTGRITSHLVKMAKSVITADVSFGNLKIAVNYFDKNNIQNVDPILIQSPEEFTKIKDFDIFYSVIVIQHNPPTLQHFMLDNIFKNINENGLVLFQMPTYIPNYSFEAESYLAKNCEGIEMHCLPQAIILGLMQSNNIQVLEVCRDSWAGHRINSYTFFGIKKSVPANK